MKTKIEIKTIWGSLLFEYECENNSVKETVINAIKSGADLIDANLSDANLSGANLIGAKINENTGYFNISCPEEGSFIAFKKASGKIIKLLITETSKRSSATSLKCRASEAKVLSFENLDGSECQLTEIASNYDYKFIYKIGETVTVENFDDNRWNECSTGIHFFTSKEQAKQYN